MKLVDIKGVELPIDEGPFTLDENDFLLFGMLTDAVYMPELTWKDPANFDYNGCYRVRDYQYIINRLKDNYAIVSCARSVGKALADDELVLTPAGWIEIAKLKAGDCVIGSDGRPTRVLGVYPQGTRELFDVHFTDGASVRCDGEHRWWVNTDTWSNPKRRGVKGPRTRTTRQIAASTMRYKVPLVMAVDSPPTHLPASPWLVGVLLGDGSFTNRSSLSFSASEPEIVDRVSRELLDADLGELMPDRGIDYYIRRQGQAAGGRSRPPEILRLFRDWQIHPGTSSDIFIPAEYLQGSIEQRAELLRGIVDADGTVTHAGGIEVSVASERFAGDIRQLALSLGGRARVRRGAAGYRREGTYVACKDRHRVTMSFAPGFMPCWLERKCATYTERYGCRTRDTLWRGISEVEPVGHGPATCIKVQADDGLFVTADYVLTHNTESEKIHAEIHVLRSYDRLLITAPELIHLLPLTDEVEDKIQDSRLLREFLDLRNGQTGFQHRPFQANFIDGTKIVGRIPKLTGTGVKGQHQDHLIVEEGQDYPERGWTEVNETVNYESRDRYGQPAFRFWIYGVHSGDKSSGFDERARSHVFRKVKVTALRRPDWNRARKQNAIAAYGGTSSPDYKRNILGEPGAGVTAYFSTARVMACVDQNVTRGEKEGSEYNETIYQKQTFRAEELDDLQMNIADVLDLPDIKTNGWWAGVDVGLTDSPTMISLFADWEHQKKHRLALMRRFTLERFRTRQIRETLYAIGWHFGSNLLGMGVDVTGLGMPIFQEMEDDELCPPHLKKVTAGYTFNSNVEVGVAPDMVVEQQGVLRDHLGNLVKVIEDELTGDKTFVVMQPFIMAATHFIREDIDSGVYLFPFDTDVTSDMLQETRQRVERVGKRGESGGTRQKKGDRFHILDSFRAMAYRRRQDDILAALAVTPPDDVLEVAGLDEGVHTWTQEQIMGVLGVSP